MTTYYFDVTELIGLRAHSGIQRVVREISRSLIASEERAGRIDLVVAVAGTFHRVSAAGHGALFEDRASPAPAPGPAPGPAQDGGRAFKKLLRRIPRLFAIVLRLRFEARLRTQQDLYHGDPVCPGAGDCIVLIDTLWSGGSALSAAAKARDAGAAVVLVVYDLIPITHPELVADELCYSFPRALSRGLALADAVVTISRSGTRELLEYCGPSLAPDKVRHAYLGYDFAAPQAAYSALQKVFPPKLWPSDATTYLMLGTIEPRKGHGYVLDAFDRLWRQGGTQRLLIMGKRGWDSQRFLTRCAQHPQMGQRLFVMHDASDAMLGYALERIDALIMASSLEGFGLPLIEALSAGKPVLASNIPVFHEIAGDTALFFNCGDADAVAKVVETFEATPDRFIDAARNFRWVDWQGASRTFLQTVEDLVGALAPANASPGQATGSHKPER